MNNIEIYEELKIKYPKGRRCSSCKVILPIESFNSFKTNGSCFLHSQCITCRSKNNKKRYDNKKKKKQCHYKNCSNALKDNSIYCHFHFELRNKNKKNRQLRRTDLCTGCGKILKENETKRCEKCKNRISKIKNIKSNDLFIHENQRQLMYLSYIEKYSNGKKCKICNKTKEIYDFSLTFDKRTKNGFVIKSECKSCRALRQKEKIAKRREKGLCSVAGCPNFSTGLYCKEHRKKINESGTKLRIKSNKCIKCSILLNKEEIEKGYLTCVNCREGIFYFKWK